MYTAPPPRTWPHAVLLRNTQSVKLQQPRPSSATAPPASTTWRGHKIPTYHHNIPAPDIQRPMYMSPYQHRILIFSHPATPGHTQPLRATRMYGPPDIRANIHSPAYHRTGPVSMNAVTKVWRPLVELDHTWTRRSHSPACQRTTGTLGSIQITR